MKLRRKTLKIIIIKDLPLKDRVEIGDIVTIEERIIQQNRLRNKLI